MANEEQPDPSKKSYGVTPNPLPRAGEQVPLPPNPYEPSIAGMPRPQPKPPLPLDQQPVTQQGTGSIILKASHFKLDPTDDDTYELKIDGDIEGKKVDLTIPGLDLKALAQLKKLMP